LRITGLRVEYIIRRLCAEALMYIKLRLDGGLAVAEALRKE